jgi:hypothetical protein
VTIRVVDATGGVVFTSQQPAGTGLRRVLWNLRAGGGGGRGGGGRGGGGGAPAPPGRYTVTLEAGGQTQTKEAIVKPPVALPRISG